MVFLCDLFGVFFKHQLACLQPSTFSGFSLNGMLYSFHFFKIRLKKHSNILTDGLVWCNSMDVVPVCHIEYRVVCDAVNLPNALDSNGLFLQP